MPLVEKGVNTKQIDNTKIKWPWIKITAKEGSDQWCDEVLAFLAERDSYYRTPGFQNKYGRNPEQLSKFLETEYELEVIKISQYFRQ